MERAAWLGPELLLLAGEGDTDDQAAAGDFVQTLVLRRNGNERARMLRVVLAGSAPSPVDAAQLADSVMDPLPLLKDELGKRPDGERKEALRFLWAAVAPILERSRSFAVARVLARIQQELRPPGTPLFGTQDASNAAHVDIAYQLAPRALWTKGWLHDRDATTERLTLVAPEGGRAELWPGMFRTVRRDLDKAYGDSQGALGWRQGFVCFTELDGPSYISSGWLLELEAADGPVEKPGPEIVRDPLPARHAILSSLRHEATRSDELIRDHLHPAIATIQDELAGTTAVDSVVQLGEPPSSPAVSVIVPLYRRLSFLEDQMAQWACDSEIAGQDLIYVLDSPEDAAHLEQQARALHSLYGIPFRFAVMKGNAGFAGVNNSAAGLARADTLLLLNSDVVPDRPGWLGRMSAFYDATPQIGALGPKLLYEDDSLQHAGMYFYREAEAPLWENMHYFKGQHRYLPAANVARRVPAVTGACMMVRRELYEQAGGLSHRYVQGGYEDSDFCLRLLEEGHEHWYMPGAELYHLEDQSYPRDVRDRATHYNVWLQNETWRERIAQVMEQLPGPT